MTGRFLVFLVCTVLCLAAQLACTSDSPPSVALREQGQTQPTRAEQQSGDKKVEEKRGDIEAPELPSSNVPEGLELLVEQIGPAPLPHQSVRLRLTLTNLGKQEIAQLRLLEPAILLAQVKGPQDQAFRPSLDSKNLGKRVYTFSPNRTDGFGEVTPLSRMVATERITLQPKEKVTISGAFGPWRLEDGIFEQPGDYSLQLVYLTFGFRLKAKPFTVRVAKPEGDDAEALKLLSEKMDVLDGIIFCMRQYHVVFGNPNDLGLLEKIVQRYPKSSYADYARLLLARTLQHHRKYEEANEVLKTINTKDFALGATALVWLRDRTEDPKEIERLDAKLNADFYDSYEWIKDQAERVTYAELMELRKPPAERKKPEPAKP